VQQGENALFRVQGIMKVSDWLYRLQRHPEAPAPLSRRAMSRGAFRHRLRCRSQDPSLRLKSGSTQDDAAS